MKKWTDKANKEENILRVLLPSFIGIILCMSCLVGMTWAWFTASIQSGKQTIQAATYSIEIAIEDSAGNRVAAGSELTAGTTYTVTLTAEGSAEETSGYCRIDGEGKAFYTAQMNAKARDHMTFTIIPAENGVYTFTTVWGTYAGGGDRIVNGSVISSPADPSAPKEGEIPQQPSEGEIPQQPESAPSQEDEVPAGEEGSDTPVSIGNLE